MIEKPPGSHAVVFDPPPPPSDEISSIHVRGSTCTLLESQAQGGHNRPALLPLTCAVRKPAGAPPGVSH